MRHKLCLVVLNEKPSSSFPPVSSSSSFSIGWQPWMSWTVVLTRSRLCPPPLDSVSAYALLPLTTTSSHSCLQRWALESHAVCLRVSVCVCVIMCTLCCELMYKTSIVCVFHINLSCLAPAVCWCPIPLCPIPLICTSLRWAAGRMPPCCSCTPTSWSLCPRRWETWPSSRSSISATTSESSLRLSLPQVSAPWQSSQIVDAIWRAARQAGDQIWWWLFNLQSLASSHSLMISLGQLIRLTPLYAYFAPLSPPYTPVLPPVSPPSPPCYTPYHR